VKYKLVLPPDSRMLLSAPNAPAIHPSNQLLKTEQPFRHSVRLRSWWIGSS